MYILHKQLIQIKKKLCETNTKYPDNIGTITVFCVFFGGGLFNDICSVPCQFRAEQFTMWRAVVQLFEALRYKPEGRGFDSRWGHGNFFY